MSKDSRIILGMLAGLAAGVALGLLLAPQNDDQTQLTATGLRRNSQDAAENSINRHSGEDDDYNDHVEHV